MSHSWQVLFFLAALVFHPLLATPLISGDGVKKNQDVVQSESEIVSQTSHGHHVQTKYMELKDQDDTTYVDSISKGQEIESGYSTCEGEGEGEGVKDSSNSGSLAPRVVTMKVYIGREMWEATNDLVDTDVEQFMIESLEKVFPIVNDHLSNLDDGGYFVQFDKTVHRLEKSDVKIKKTYMDRTDGNSTKKFKYSNVWSHTFTFQEAVQKMEGRMDVNIRLLIIPRDILREEEGAERAISEEHCVCEPDWFGCVMVISIWDKLKWSEEGNLIAHEFGHVLGAAFHADDFYPPERATELIMWSDVDPEATVWDEKSREAILEHDNTCMERKA